jgi:hypothetical protein
MAEENGTGGPVTYPQDVTHTHASAEGQRCWGSACRARRGFNASISKALTDAPSELFEGHNGVWMTDIEEKAIVANVQHDSFFQEGADDGHWADGNIFSPRSEADGRLEVADSICLGTS